MATEAESPDEDPVAYFLEELTFHGRTDRTRRAYNRILRRFERFLHDERDATLATATRRDCMAWVHELRGSVAASTVATYASYLHRFYAYMTQVGAFTSNPMALVTQEMDESIDVDPARRDISMDRMRSFLASIGHPLDRALIVTLLKTGIRVGELCNLDLRDLHVADEEIQQAFHIDHRGGLDGRPDSVFVASEPARGAVVNGEERLASNKRRRDTVIPVDEELKAVLKAWLAIRPDVRSPAQPLFCSTSEWGRRVTPGMVRKTVAEHAERVGWYREGGGSEENVTPHYFRHFFTTHLRDRTGDRGVVKYLRGDVAQDIIDTYTHDWGGRVRAVYEDNIYQIL